MNKNVIANLDHFERVLARKGCTLERYRHSEPDPLHGIHQRDRYMGCVAPSWFIGKTETEVEKKLTQWLQREF